LERVRFLWQSIKNFKEMGTVIRSSPAMCKKMVQYIDPSLDFVIVELGAGDGVITKYILNKMSKDAKLFVFEINPELCEVIANIKDDRLFIINDSAQYMESLLINYDIDRADTIISAIPFLVLPDELTKDILQTCKKMLRKGGTFVQMHYIKSISKMYKNIFGNVQTQYVALNIPPGYVFKCIKQD
jgi:phospholipid N-methyltransferase